MEDSKGLLLTNNNQSLDFHQLLGCSKNEGSVPLFHFDFRIRSFFPRRARFNQLRNLLWTKDSSRNAASTRLNRKQVWNKYGKSMHILTLEFTDEKGSKYGDDKYGPPTNTVTEADFSKDYLRRNKTFVEYGSLVLGVVLLLWSVANRFTNEASNESVFMLWLVFLPQYGCFVGFRQFVYQYFQLFLAAFGIAGITFVQLWHMITSNRTASETFGTRSSGVEDSTSMLVFIIVLVTVYRIRFIYLFLLMVYLIFLSWACTRFWKLHCDAERSWNVFGSMDSTGVSVGVIYATLFGDSLNRENRQQAQTLYNPYPGYQSCHQNVQTPLLFGPNAQNTIFTCLLLLILSYSLEVLQRKDFIQATMVFRESKRSDTLLRNILPEKIISKLKENYSATSASYDEVTIMFTHVPDFTEISAEVDVEKIVDFLNRMFYVFDEEGKRNRVEKIKTIGDCYMAACGLPDPNPMHAKAMARFALKLLDRVHNGYLTNPLHGGNITLRIGLHSGQCVAGVIGQKKFAFDVWGDAVNTASRMDSFGLPMRVHCSQETRDLIYDDFFCEARQPMTIKGKGVMQTYFVHSQKEPKKQFVVARLDELKTRNLADALDQAKNHLSVEEINSLITTFAGDLLNKRAGGAQLDRQGSGTKVPSSKYPSSNASSSHAANSSVNNSQFQDLHRHSQMIHSQMSQNSGNLTTNVSSYGSLNQNASHVSLNHSGSISLGCHTGNLAGMTGHGIIGQGVSLSAPCMSLASGVVPHSGVLSSSNSAGNSLRQYVGNGNVSNGNAAEAGFHGGGSLGGQTYGMRNDTLTHTKAWVNPRRIDARTADSRETSGDRQHHPIDFGGNNTVCNNTTLQGIEMLEITKGETM